MTVVGWVCVWVSEWVGRCVCVTVVVWVVGGGCEEWWGAGGRCGQCVGLCLGMKVDGEGGGVGGELV